MKITNKHGLPKALTNYVRSNKYSPGKADWSVTTLIDSPRIFHLYNKHRDEIEKDISEDILPILGSAVHSILEQGAHFDCVTEERLFTKRYGRTISGQIDIQEFQEDGTVKLIDFKVTSTWSKINGYKEDWVNQLNCYAELVEENKDYSVSSLWVCVIYRDWRAAEIGRRHPYPTRPIEMIEIPLWDKETRARYLDDRVSAFIYSEDISKDGDRYPLCSNSERWIKDGKFALMRQDRVKAMKLFDTEGELVTWCLKGGLATGTKNSYTIKPPYYIQEREKKYTRCESWCNVSKWCNQYKADLVENKIRKSAAEKK